MSQERPLPMMSFDWIRAIGPVAFRPPWRAYCVNCRVLCDVDREQRCFGCAWWADLAAVLQGCYDAMVAGDGDKAAEAWQSSWGRLRPVFGICRRRSSRPTTTGEPLTADPHPAVVDAADDRAAKLCWQFSYGVMPDRLRDVNRSGEWHAWHWGSGNWRTLTPAMFRSQAAAAARVARRRYEARSVAPDVSIVATAVRLPAEMRGPLPDVPDLAAKLYRDGLAALRREESKALWL